MLHLTHTTLVTYIGVAPITHVTHLCRKQLHSREVTLCDKNDFTYYKELYHNDVTSGSEITPCNKVDNPLVVYGFSGNVMTSITTLHTE